jgi:hypothetical protein
MLINLKPHDGLAAKLAPYSHWFREVFARGGQLDSDNLVLDLTTTGVPRDLFEEASMYILAHAEVPLPEQVPEFNGTEFSMEVMGDEFEFVAHEGRVLSMSHLEAKQLAAWILAQ